MLLQFTIRNYKSFRDETTFNLVASNDKEHPSNLFKVNDKLKLLKTSAIYGSNATGKTNIFKALAVVKNLVLNSSKESQASQAIPVDYFRLDTASEGKSSLFEVVFIHEKVLYRYGFEADALKIHSEWLHYVPKTKTVELYSRKGQEFTIGAKFKEGKGLEDKTRPNALFISVAAQFNGEISKKVLEWFSKLNALTNIDDEEYKHYTMQRLDEEKFKSKVVKFIQVADLSIENLETRKEKIPANQLPDFLPPEILKQLINQEGTSIKTFHKRFDNKKLVDSAQFDLANGESAGTIRMVFLSGPIIDTLEEGKILFIDELDSKLHPLLTQFIINLFHSKETNPKNAQLVFASHNTHLFSNKIFRRDQLCLIEKDRYGVSNIFSLNEYKSGEKSIRKDANFEKDYLLGKYGAIPLIFDEESIFQSK